MADRVWGRTIAQIARGIPGARGSSQVSPSTVFRWIREGCPSVTGERVKLRATRVGARWLVAESDLADFFAALGSPAATATTQTRTDKQRKQAAERAASELVRRGA